MTGTTLKEQFCQPAPRGEHFDFNADGVKPLNGDLSLEVDANGELKNLGGADDIPEHDGDDDEASQL